MSFNDKTKVGVEKISTLFPKECQVHAHWGMMPCPWPDCPNGARNDKIDTTIFPLPDSEPIIYERKSCNNFKGELRYYWYKENDISDWPAIALTYNEVKRAINSTPPPLIYHYTTLKGFFDILESGELWMTDYSYLNDFKEIEHGLNLFISQIKDFHERRSDSSTKSLLSSLLEIINQQQLPRFCITSFSLDGDSLSQWRGYGRGRNGISIGFTRDSTYWNSMSQTQLHQIIYDDDIQSEIVRHFLYYHSMFLIEDENREIIHPRTKKKRFMDLKQLSDFYCNAMRYRLLEFISFFKNKGFSDEKEIRLVYTEIAELFDSFRIQKAPTRFRVSEGLLIPYCTTKDLQAGKAAVIPDSNSDNNLPISEVIIGPQEKEEVVKRGIQEYLNKKGYESVVVKSSGVPYR